jgi:hypothetical protein
LTRLACRFAVVWLWRCRRRSRSFRARITAAVLVSPARDATSAARRLASALEQGAAGLPAAVRLLPLGELMGWLPLEIPLPRPAGPSEEPAWTEVIDNQQCRRSIEALRRSLPWKIWMQIGQEGSAANS